MKWFSLGSYKPLFSLQKGQLYSNKQYQGTFFYLIQYPYTRVSPRDSPYLLIRASVDALCRDGTSEISRDPRTKRLQSRRESLARPSKHTNNNF